MSGAACKAAVCNINELASTPPGYCLEAIIREKAMKSEEIVGAVGELAETHPRIYNFVIVALESPQMDPGQQELFRHILLNIYRDPDDWVEELGDVGRISNESES